MEICASRGLEPPVAIKIRLVFTSLWKKHQCVTVFINRPDNSQPAFVQSNKKLIIRLDLRYHLRELASARERNERFPSIRRSICDRVLREMLLAIFVHVKACGSAHFAKIPHPCTPKLDVARDVLLLRNVVEVMLLLA